MLPCSLGLSEGCRAASPHTPEGSGPPDPGKAILCQVCCMCLSQGHSHHSAGCRGGQALPDPQALVTGKQAILEAR